jgi:hypothetical protein
MLPSIFAGILMLALRSSATATARAFRLHLRCRAPTQISTEYDHRESYNRPKGCNLRYGHFLPSPVLEGTSTPGNLVNLSGLWIRKW